MKMWILFLAVPLAGWAGVLAQFDLSVPGNIVTGADGRVEAWLSPGGPALVPAVTDSPAWACPALAATNGLQGVFFNLSSNPASPLGFAPSATGTVATLLLVVAGAGDGYATLLQSPVVATVTPYALGTEYDAAEAADGLLRVNGSSPALFGAGVPHIVEADFAEPAALSCVFIGGTPACAAWGQNWRGAVYEVVALDAPPTESARLAIRNYFALRYGVAGLPAAGRAGVFEAFALGLNAHGFFGTRLFFR